MLGEKARSVSSEGRMETYLILLVAICLLVLVMLQQRKSRNAAIVNHRLNHKGKEIEKMKELAERFIGKKCLVYTIASDSSAVNGVIKEVTGDGILVEGGDGNVQAVNLEYVTRIREWPKNSKGKEKVVFS